MYDIVITCKKCGAERTYSHVEQSELGDTEVLARAGHAPSCTFSSAVSIESAQRESEPNVILYSIEEVR